MCGWLVKKNILELLKKTAEKLTIFLNRFFRYLFLFSMFLCTIYLLTIQFTPDIFMSQNIGNKLKYSYS